METEHGPPSSHSSKSRHSQSSNSSSQPLEFAQRIASFRNFPNTANVNPFDLADFGFIFNDTTRSVTCSGCNKAIDVNIWNQNDKAYEPRFHMEGCQFINAELLSSETNKATVPSNEESTKPYETASTSGLQQQSQPSYYQPQQQHAPMSPASYQPTIPTLERTQVLQAHHSSMPASPARRVEMTTVHRRDERGMSSYHQVLRQESHSPSPAPSQSSSHPSSSSGFSPHHSLSLMQSNPPSFHSSIQESSSSLLRPGPSRRLDEQFGSVNQPSHSQYASSRLENPDPAEDILALNMRIAENRLLTFERFWSMENEFRNIRLLVICGFFCLGQGDAVECFCCHIIAANWTRDDNPRDRHLALSPRCRFIKGENCGDTPLPIERRSPRSSPAQSLVFPSFRSSHTSRLSPSPHSSPHHSLHSLSPIAHPSLEGTGPLSAPVTPIRSPQRAPQQSRSTSLSVPPVSPARENPPERAPSPVQEVSLREPYQNPTPSLIERSNLMLGFPCANPYNPGMREKQRRLQTFSTNPNFRRSTPLRASDETLAQAGLYYLGERDRVKCWYCGGGLQEFVENDDPWVEHAKFYPNCEHLLQQRGPGWVTSISVQNPNIERPGLPAHNQQQNLPNVVSSPTPLPPEPPTPNDPVEINRRRQQLLNIGMQSEPVQVARRMGYPDDRIREVQMQNIINRGCCYQSSEHLINALLNNNAPGADGAAAQSPAEGAAHGSGNNIYMDGQTIRITGGNFVGPSVINGQTYFPPNNSSNGSVTYSSTSSSSTSNPGGEMIINGQTMDQYMANAFNHPFFRGEMDHLLEGHNGPVYIPPMNVGQPDIVINNIRRNITTRTYNPRAPPVRRVAPTTSNVVRAPVPRPPASTNTVGGASAAPVGTGSSNERLEALERERRCKVCLDADAEILFQPCGHICTCQECATRVQSCPVCRSHISSSVRTFRS